MVSAEKTQCHAHFVRVTMCFPSRPGRWNIRPGTGKTVIRQSFILDGKQPPPGCFSFAKRPAGGIKPGVFIDMRPGIWYN